MEKISDGIIAFQLYSEPFIHHLTSLLVTLSLSLSPLILMIFVDWFREKQVTRLNLLVISVNVQAYLRDIVGSVPGQSRKSENDNKVRHMNFLATDA